MRTEDQTLGVIKNQVKIKIESKGVHPNSSMNKKTCTKWGISNVVFKPKVRSVYNSLAFANFSSCYLPNGYVVV